MCPHTAVQVSSDSYIFVRILLCVLILLYVSSYYYTGVKTLLYVSSYYYICVLTLIYCPHTNICVRMLLLMYILRNACLYEMRVSVWADKHVVYICTILQVYFVYICTILQGYFVYICTILQETRMSYIYVLHYRGIYMYYITGVFMCIRHACLL